MSNSMRKFLNLISWAWIFIAFCAAQFFWIKTLFNIAGNDDFFSFLFALVFGGVMYQLGGTVAASPAFLLITAINEKN